MSLLLVALLLEIPEARAVYDEALAHWKTRTEEGLSTSRELFEKAARIDPEFARARAGISDRLLRLSIGIEDADDLLHDLDAALGAAAAVVTPRRAGSAASRPAAAGTALR